MSRAKSVGVNVILVCISIIFVLILLEIAVRIFMPQQLPTIRADIWRPREVIGFERWPNVDTVVNVGEGPVVFQTNEHGHRIGPSSHKDGNYRIIVLGDSFLEALAVKQELTIPAHLEKDLSEALGEPLLVANTAVSAYDPNHYLIKAREELARETAQIVLVFLYVGNDIQADKIIAYPPREPQEPSIRIPESISPRQFFKNVIYPTYRYIIYYSHLAVITKKQLFPLFLRLGLTKRGNEWLAIFDRREANSRRWETTADICEEIAVEGGKYGASTLFVILPSDIQVDKSLSDAAIAASGLDPSLVDLNQPQRLMKELLVERGLEVMDATPALKRAWDEGIQTHLVFDRHLTAEGHKVVALEIEPWIIQRLRSQRSIDDPPEAARIERELR